MNKLDRNQPRKQNMVWQKVGLACGTALTWALGNLPISAQEVKFDNLPANQPAAAAPAAPSLLSPVQPVSYNQPAADGAMLGTATVRLPASSRYQLRWLNCEQFEKALVECWMTSPLAEAVDGGRSIRVWIPGSPENASMLIDRVNRSVAFEGSANQTASWQAAVMAIDSMSYAQGKQSLRVMELNKLSPSLVRQVAYVASGPQDQQPALPGQPQQPEQVQRALPLNPQAGGQMPQIVTQTDQTGQVGQTLGGNVSIQVFEEANLIILTGDKDDVAVVEKAIRDIYQTAGGLQPKIERIPISNSDPTSTATTVQAVYDAIYANAQGSASITAVQEPRGLLVIAREDAIKTIKDIVAQYDVEATEKTITFRAFQLKYMSSDDAKQRVDEYFGQAPQTPLATPLSALPVVTIADYRSNQLIVKASKNYIDQVEELLAKLDTEETGSVKAVRIFKLRNTVASDIALVLQNSLNGQQPNAGVGFAGNQQGGFGGNQGFQQNNTQTTPGRSSVGSSSLQLMTLDRAGNQIKSGILFDVRVNADNSSNSLVITAPTASMALIETLIDQLDQIPNAETQIKVFQILNGDAQTLLTMLQTLFASTQQAGGGQFGGGGIAQGGLGQLPLQNAAASEGQTLVNLRLAIDTRTNSIIVSGPVGDLQVVEDLLTRLDEADLNQRRIVVYRLSNNAVLDVADALNTWLADRETLITSDPSYVNQIVQNRYRITVTPEVVSNSLIISATPQFMPEVLGTIKALDRRPPVVKVKLLIAEVNLSMLEEFGLEMGVQDSVSFIRGLDFANSTNYIGYPFNQQTTGNASNADSLKTRELLAGQGLSNLGVGRINSDLGYGGLVLSAGNESINLLLRALQNKSCIRVLSKPEIFTIENQQGRIQVGARAPYVTGVTQTNFGIQNTVTLQDVGIIVDVTPRVSPDGMIVMKVDATKSRLGPEEDGVVIFVPETGDPLRQPQILITTAQTTIMSRSGQTVAFAGLVTEDKAKVRRQPPILGDIPLIGPLFRYESEDSARTELLILMTPYIVDGEQDLEAHNAESMDRMHWCLCDVSEIYGDTRYEQPPHYTSPEIFYPDQDPAGMNPQRENPEGAPGVAPDQMPSPAPPASPLDSSSQSSQQSPKGFGSFFTRKDK
jgi:general secretion pathway protein D